MRTTIVSDRLSAPWIVIRRTSRRRASLALAALVLISSSPVLRASAASPSDPVRVVNEELKSKLVKTTLPYNVILPRDYLSTQARNRRYPVIYLLHGLTGHFSNWVERTKVSEYSRLSDVLIVMPEGNNGWYTDSATVPDHKYESYVIEELIPEVDRKFRTIESREGRAIAGLSMGGYGALKFGVKHPNKFIFAGSMSGALDAAGWTEAELKGLTWIWETLVPVFGPSGGPTREANDLMKLYPRLSAEQITALPYIYLDCGTEDPLLNSNRKFAEMLLERKIPHQVRLLPGKHNWQYWDQQVSEIIRLAATRMAAAKEGAAQSKSN